MCVKGMTRREAEKLQRKVGSGRGTMRMVIPGIFAAL